MTSLRAPLCLAPAVVPLPAQANPFVTAYAARDNACGARH